MLSLVSTLGIEEEGEEGVVRNFYLSLHFSIHPSHLDLTMLSLVSTSEIEEGGTRGRGGGS
jgi:hypothetical protein